MRTETVGQRLDERTEGLPVDEETIELQPPLPVLAGLQREVAAAGTHSCQELIGGHEALCHDRRNPPAAARAAAVR